MAEIRSFPNNQDTYIGAEEVMRWLHGRTSGVFAAAGNAAVAALETPGMAVTVTDGTGWLTDAGGNGVVWWNDTEKTTGAKLILNVEMADAVLDRIDRVIVEWETTNYVDLPEIKVLKGTASSTAEAPALTNNSTVRQISLARVAVGAGITAVTASMITDERLDPSVCGLVTDGLSIDTTTINAQYTALLDSLAQELAALEAGTAVELKKLAFANTAVAVSTWADDSTYEDYPYRAAVALSGVTAAMIPEVVFGLAAMSENSFAPVAECYNGGVYIYAADVPESTITIPTIICWRGAAT
nr:MAG TPA: Receptor Binding Protein [Caudoviricetes sp.]